MVSSRSPSSAVWNSSADLRLPRLPPERRSAEKEKRHDAKEFAEASGEGGVECPLAPRLFCLRPAARGEGERLRQGEEEGSWPPLNPGEHHGREGFGRRYRFFGDHCSWRSLALSGLLALIIGSGAEPVRRLSGTFSGPGRANTCAAGGIVQDDAEIFGGHHDHRQTAAPRLVRRYPTGLPAVGGAGWLRPLAGDPVRGADRPGPRRRD